MLVTVLERPRMGVVSLAFGKTEVVGVDEPDLILRGVHVGRNKGCIEVNSS